jgi:hypothetical protein
MTASMGFKCGIVGLPNVGKSTLFNALTQTAAAQAANYPFCTIEPNVGDVAVPDPRLAKLAEIAASKEIIPTRLSFVDIAGLVRGASKGEGLGNQFPANIRECDAIAHVVRCFDDGDVTHVEGRVDPLSDIATIETELMLADLESLERRIPQMRRRPRAATRRPRNSWLSPSGAWPSSKRGARRAPPKPSGKNVGPSSRSASCRRSRFSMSATSTRRRRVEATPIPIRSRNKPPRKARSPWLCRRRLRARSPCCLRASRRPISRRSD